MATAAEKDLKALRKEFGSMMSDLTEMSDTVSQLAHDGMNKGRARVRGAAKRTRKQARETSNAIEHEFEERPIVSLAVALGVGVIIGKLFFR